MKFSTSHVHALLLALAMSACLPRTEKSETKIVDYSHEGLVLKADDASRAIAEADYALAPTLDSTVLSERKTDVRGRIYLPEGKGPFPVLVYLHGNHATCGIPASQEGDPRIDDQIWYTDTGSCTPPANEGGDGKTRVESPSHLGYAYSARQMASHGYAVISINANLGITAGTGTTEDPGLVAARGALVLRHLATLRSWSLQKEQGPLFNFPNASTTQLFQKLDFSEVGLMGHSRGGEGVRYAYNIYQSAPAGSHWKQALPDLKIKGVFEIGPVDFGTRTERVKVEARGTAWAVLLGGCDGDVSNFMGTGPYARMLQMNDGFPKAVFAVWGANHNFFNTEWQVSDAPHACLGTQKPLWDYENRLPLDGDANALQGLTGSEKQQEFAKSLMYAFFRANVGKNTDASLMDTFDPQYALPSHLAKLAPTSREIVRVGDSLLLASPGKQVVPGTQGEIHFQSIADKLKSDKQHLQDYWNEVAKQEGYQELTVQLSDEEFLRNSLILDSPVLTTEQSFDIAFDSQVNSKDYWTMDASFAQRVACYPDTACELDTTIPKIEVALIYADGSNSQYVKLSDYIKLENYHDTFLQYDGAEAKNPEETSYDLFYSYVPLLYSMARFELTDFDLKSTEIKGMRLRFPAQQAVSLAIDEIRLVKRHR